MIADTPFIGIDFGTCNSSMAWFNPRTRQAEILKNAEGEEKTPSLVYFGEDEILVGKLAEEAIADEEMRPLVYPPGAKRDIGKKSMVVTLSGRLVRPQDVAVEVIRKLKQDAEGLHFQAEVPRAVITVPATFDQLEQERIQEAGRRAGLQEVVLLEEPVAAALAYTHGGYRVDHHVMVFDLGGGTFDLALLARDGEPDRFVLAQEPRGLRKGGEDFDRALYAFLEREAQKEGRSLTSNSSIDLQILRQCRERKENLSARSEALFSSLLPDGRPFRYRLNRATLETLIKDTLAEMVEQAGKMLEQASGSRHRIDTVVLVGGSSRVPLVAELLQERMPVKAQKWHQQDVAVALGAAYHAEMLWAMKSSDTRPPIKTGPYLGLEVDGISPVNTSESYPPIRPDEYPLLEDEGISPVSAPESWPPIKMEGHRDKDDNDPEGIGNLLSYLGPDADYLGEDEYDPKGADGMRPETITVADSPTGTPNWDKDAWDREKPQHRGIFASFLRKFIGEKEDDHETAAENRFSTAISKLKKGNPKGAFNIINKLLQTNPDFIKPWEICGDWYYEHKEYADALCHYEESIKLGTVNPRAYVRAAISASKTEDSEKAYAILKEGTTKLSHDDVPGLLWYNLGCYATRLQENDEAMVYLRAAFNNGFTDIAKYLADPDLTPLRRRNDFSVLLGGQKKPASVRPGPGRLIASQKTDRMVDVEVGTELLFHVTGSCTGIVYGTDVYTSDSDLATAAVHSGALKPGETAIVAVSIVPVLPNYQGSFRNGVTTRRSWATPWTGAYRVVRAET